MIATYIQELLATNNRVIVPNFGAFLVRATSKSKDANTLEEKLKDIYFSPFLKFNDELLEKHIIKKEGVSKEEAAKKITEFIDSVKKELEAEKPFIIKDFGHFEADKQGKVQFITVAKEEKSEAKTAAKPAATKKTTTKAAASAKASSDTTKKTEAKKEETKKPDASVGKEETKKEEPKAAAEPPKPEVKAEDSKTKTDASKLQEYKSDKKEPEKPRATVGSTQSKPVYSYKKEKKPINKGLVWSIAIGVPVAALFVWALLNFNTVQKVFKKDKAKTEKVAQKKKAATTKKATTKKTEEKKQTTKTTADKPKQEIKQKPQETATKKQPVQPQKKYYIIAGSFKNEKYANAYLNKLKAEGYNAEKLEERNGMHAVSYNSFTDKRKAIAEYKFLAQEKGLQAWILYY